MVVKLFDDGLSQRELTWEGINVQCSVVAKNEELAMERFIESMKKMIKNVTIHVLNIEEFSKK